MSSLISRKDYDILMVKATTQHDDALRSSRLEATVLFVPSNTYLGENLKLSNPESSRSDKPINREGERKRGTVQYGLVPSGSKRSRAWMDVQTATRRGSA